MAINEPFTLIATYHPALLALAILCFAVLTQALLTAPLAFIKGEQAPGSPIQGDHALLSFRALRTHANSAESLAPFGLSLLVAIAAGSSSSLVNWLAGLHVGFRLLFWVIYYQGIGQVAGGPRTLAFVGGLLTNMILTGTAIYALLR